VSFTIVVYDVNIYIYNYYCFIFLKIKLHRSTDFLSVKLTESILQDSYSLRVLIVDSQAIFYVVTHSSKLFTCMWNLISMSLILQWSPDWSQEGKKIFARPPCCYFILYRNTTWDSFMLFQDSLTYIISESYKM
jgi:hypothetical protein